MNFLYNTQSKQVRPEKDARPALHRAQGLLIIQKTPNRDPGAMRAVQIAKEMTRPILVCVEQLHGKKGMKSMIENFLKNTKAKTLAVYHPDQERAPGIKTTLQEVLL